MYAVIATGGKQYRVAPGDVFPVERLDTPAGERVTFEEVLAVQRDGAGLAVGNPKVAEARVIAQVLRHDRSEKVRVFKKKRRKAYRRTRGHRQQLSWVKILEIS